MGHDIAIECQRLDDFLESYKEGMWGTVETGAAIAYRLIRQELPDLRVITVHRAVVDVDRSLRRFGIEVLEELESRSSLLELIGRQEGVESIYFNDLEDPFCCRWLFEYCLELPWDLQWWQLCQRLNIQVDMTARVQQLIRNRERIEELKREVTERLKRLSPLQMDS